MSSAIYLNDLGLVCALGADKTSVRDTLLAAQRQVQPVRLSLPDGSSHPSAPVTTPLVDINHLPLQQRSRNNALILTALQQIRPAVDQVLTQYGPERIAVVLGTSTSGIGESEQAFLTRQQHDHFPAHFHPEQQTLGSPAQMLSQQLGTSGLAMVISTACSSSAKALASAARLLQANLCDAVICGGADALCGFTVAGFAALESVSATGCNPLSAQRDGIHIGEASTLFIMSKNSSLGSAPIQLCGYGESADAYHISAPDPSGQGAMQAMQLALNQAGLEAQDIDYINLHGTGTLQNDAMESLAVAKLFGQHTPVSSTKALSGHTLGAAGALEAAFAWLCLQDNPTYALPPHHWNGVPDPDLPHLSLVRPQHTLTRPIRYILSNSFAFGGSNASLILGYPPAGGALC